jgi:hypothetical protein
VRAAQVQRHSSADSTPPLSGNMSVQTPVGGCEGLRERNATQTIREEDSSSGSSGLETPQDGDDVEKEMKTFGRTPSGTSEFGRRRGRY